MLKSHHRELEITHKVVDLLIVLVSWWAAYFLRFETVSKAQPGLGPWYFKTSIVLLIISYYYFRREGLYTSKRLDTMFRELMSVLRANTVSFIIFVLVMYFLSNQKISRVVLVNYYVLSSASLLVFKYGIRRFLRKLRAQGKNIRHAVLVGNGEQLKTYVKKLLQHKEVGINVKGWVDSEGTAEQLGMASVKTISKDNLKELAPDLVVIGYKNKDAHKADTVSRTLLNSFTETLILPDLTNSLIGYNIVDFHGLPVIMVNEPNIKSRSMILKRVFDLVFSILGLIILSPIFLLLALIIKYSSKGPVFYSQERMGLDGKRFRMWKFRTMVVGDKNNSGWTVKDDPRVTKVGRVLRKTSLDELPQLINVFWGDMSLVGPRPERPKFVERFREEIPTYMLRHKMKAGMTGWAQINGWRGNTSIEKRIECDLYYIKNWSLWMDVSIIMMTFWKGFFHKNAY